MGVKAPMRRSLGQTVKAHAVLFAGAWRRSDPAGTHEREGARAYCPRVGHDKRNVAERWLKHADGDASKRSNGLTSDAREELRRLRLAHRALRKKRCARHLA